jgi:3-oxoacyl-[acyl-carrier protein] reductase
MSLSDKVVVITGGAQGVGRYVARTFAAEGAKVAIADIGPMETISNEVTALGADFLTMKTDITHENEVKALMDQVYQQWGRIDVLINDAGINPHFHVGSPRWPRIRDMPEDQFDRVMRTNLVGTFLCTKHVLPYMESLNAGHIINFGQGNVSEARHADIRPNIGTCVYNVSKISIRAFTRYVAEEEADFNICVLSMSPGGVTQGEAPRVIAGPGIPGGGGGIVTEDSPAWAREHHNSLTVDAVGNRYVLAADAPMEFSGHQVVVRDGALAIASD